MFSIAFIDLFSVAIHAHNITYIPQPLDSGQLACLHAVKTLQVDRRMRVGEMLPMSWAENLLMTTHPSFKCT